MFYVDPADLELINATRAAYEAELSRRGFDPITTQIAWAQDPARPLKFWPAEEYHQKYLQKNPDGYDCHAHTGIDLPSLAECLQAAN